MYETKVWFNGGAVAIRSDDGRDIAFMQGDEAGAFLDELASCEGDEDAEQDLMGQYDIA